MDQKASKICTCGIISLTTVVVMRRFALTVWFHEASCPDGPLNGTSPATQPSKLPQSKPSPPKEDRIFVSIAAFRDPETRWTVRDVLTKAAHPSRLRIGIVWQLDLQQDADFLDLPCTTAEKAQVSSANVPDVHLNHHRVHPI